MNTKKPSFLMLVIGLAVGILVGYSLHDRPITTEERAYLKDREAREPLATVMSQIRPDYLTMLEHKLKVVQVTNWNVTPIQMQHWPQPGIRSNSRLDENSWPSPAVNKQKDLIDQRYTPPYIERP